MIHCQITIIGQTVVLEYPELQELCQRRSTSMISNDESSIGSGMWMYGGVTLLALFYKESIIF